MKTYSGNQSFLKDLNLISALRQIRFQGLISRAELADVLGLNRSTITAIVGELIERKLVREVGVGSSKGGRPPTLLQFNQDAGYTVCIDWGARQIRINITDLGGKSFFSTSIDLESLENTPHTQIKFIIDIILSSIPLLPEKDLGILGIGICVPGIIEAGWVAAFNLGWERVPLASYFSEHFDCPIIIDSDANAGLIAENYFGSAIGERDFCYVRIGRGLSAGVLLNGQIYRGSEGFAGKVGHFTIDVNGRKCICGNKGCWEAYVSERALIQRYREYCGESQFDESIDPEQIMNLAKETDPHAISAIHEFAEYLGIGISNIGNFLNPNIIIIGSSIHEIDHLLYKPLNNILQQRTLPLLRKNMRVLFSSLGEKAITLGATALVLDNIFSSPMVKA